MNEQQDSSYLMSIKGTLRDMLNNPIARLANVSYRLVSLQNKGEVVLPRGDAAAFRASLQPLIEKVDLARELLIKGAEQLEGVRYIHQEHTYE